MVNSVSVVRQLGGMKVEWSDPIGAYVVYQVFCWAALHCTALRANRPKHPSGCLQFAKMEEGDERKGENPTFIQQLLQNEV